MHLHRHPARLFLCASLFVAPALLNGCSGDGVTYSNGQAPALISGNWQISSADAIAAHLPALSGELTNTSGALTGVLHSQSASACVAPATTFQVTGKTSETGGVTLTGPVAGGTVTVTGTLAEDGKSLTGVSYNVSGGSCAFTKAVTAQAEVFAPVDGFYSGNFTDADGVVAGVEATLTQSADPAGDGNYTLSGTATVTNNPCFSASVPVTNTQVTGGTFTFTDPTLGGSVTANGTFSADASTLTVTQWTSSGTCGADTGTGSMTQQPVL